MRRLFCLFLCALVLSAPARARDGAKDTLIVISIDGFRADYLDRGLTPTLARLAKHGVRATGMRPVFPSVTLPNHMTLMTGKTADHHGIIDNTMTAPDIPGWFGGPDQRVLEDPRWWQGAKPLWITAEEQGVPSGEMFWWGAQIPYAGKLPSFRRPANDLSLSERVDALLAWLDNPPARRPRFITLYFPPVDDAGHSFGPDSREVNAALAEVDSAVARLVAGLDRRRMADSTNLVILADHGMTDVSYERAVMAESLVDTSKLFATSFGAVLGAIPAKGHETEVANALVRPHDHLTCWRKADIPAHLRYGTNARVPAIFCVAEPGWLILTEPIKAYLKGHFPQGFKGNHGYDPANPDMAALFIAKGPAFRRGITIAPFDNVDVYPMLARVLRVTAESNDGDIKSLAPILQKH